jgi:hypothetical protein
MNVDYKNAEQFESIARSEGFHDLDVMGNGCYADDFLQHFYLGWQASRQAPVAAKAARLYPIIEDQPYSLFVDSLSEIERLQARVAELYDLIKYAQVDSGVCMCGDAIKDHNQSSGHSPVDVWDHAVEQIDKGGTSEAFILRKQAEAVDVAASFYCAVMETEDLAREIRLYRGRLAREAYEAENAGGL